MIPAAVLPAPWHVVARNIAADSGNDIHDDEAAKQLGYERALVAGITTYGYAVRQVVAALGEEWLERGTLEVRLRQPAYEGDRFTVTVEDQPLASVHVAVTRDHDAMVVATADATPGAPGLLPPTAHPLTAARSEPYPAQRAALESVRHLPSVEYTIDETWQHKLLTDLDNDLDIFNELGVVHPVIYGDVANISFMNGIALGPWIHARSRVRHHRALRIGETVSVRPRIAGLQTIRDTEHITLDTAVVVDDRVVARIEHAAIYAFNRRPA